MANESARPADVISPGQVMFGHHAVALIDFLGQAAELAKWDFLPNSPSQAAEFVTAARNMWGRIVRWREEFERLVNQFTSFEVPPQYLAGLSSKQRNELERMRECAFRFSHFSDTVVVYSPIENAHGYLTVSGIYAMIAVTGSLLLAALNSRTVFRGAIEIGMAARFPKADLYGPALAKAHHLESRIAQYPRIVVGPTLVSYLGAVQKEVEQDPAARANRQTASLCMSLLGKDEAGCWFVDYLGEAFAALGGKPDAWKEIRQTAFEFVRHEKERFERDNDEKLADRYSRLLAYFVSHGCTP